METFSKFKVSYVQKNVLNLYLFFFFEDFFSEFFLVNFYIQMTNIQTENGQLHYTRHPGGDKVLLAFHGFGQDNSIFDDWIDVISKEYTVYAFDLFYHGKSTRMYEKLTKVEWKKYLKAFLEKEQINDFSILGFSLGGRFAIASTLSFPSRVNELILIAPDGVFLTIWFKFVTNPFIRWIFKYLILNPNKLDSLMEFNDRYQIVSPYVGDFVRKEMGDSENRKRVYISWNYFKTLGYSKKELKEYFNQFDFKRKLIIGSKDHIIKPNQILPIIRKMGDFQIEILPKKHHQLIKPDVAELIANEKAENE